MTKLANMFDSYGRQARLYPGLLTALPGVVTVLAWWPELLSSSATTTLLTIFITCGVFYALAVYARSRGKIAEKRLLSKWGGWPTTLWLRHRDTNLPAAAKERYHSFLQSSVPGIALPNSEAEASDLEKADDAYASAVKWLQERCRGDNFPLVEKENAEYGFRRNLRGLKVAGLLISTLAIVFSAVAIFVLQVGSEFNFTKLTNVDPIIYAALVFDLLAVLAWLMVVNDGWVREAGDQYARALLACCDQLSEKT